MTRQRSRATVNPVRPPARGGRGEPALPERLRGWRSPADTASRALADCSLVVATYRRADEVIRLLDHLVTLPWLPAELAVIDGSPEERTEEAVRAWAAARPLPFDLLYVDSPPGLTRQRNVGIDSTRGDLVFFLDDDALPLDDYFRRIREVFHSDDAGDVGAVGGRAINGMGAPPGWRWRLRFRLGLVPDVEPGRYLSIGSGVPGSRLAPFTGCRPVELIYGFSMTFRREVFDAERFSLFFQGYAQGEDIEMSLRVSRRWRVLWCGDALVNHRSAPEGRPRGFSKGRMEVRNRVFIWRRHVSDISRADRVRFWADVAFMLCCDLAGAVRQPRRIRWFVSHGLGLACGLAECLVASPRYDEPPPVRRYVPLVQG